MVEEKNGEVVLDNGVCVTPVFNYFCSKCKKNLSKDQYCFDCNSLSYKSIINLGYYTPRWYYKNDAYTDPSIKKTNDLFKINAKYRFCKMINDAKTRWTENTIPNKKKIIELLCDGFIWKVQKYDSWILNRIDLLIHVPKKNENPQKDENNISLFNHGYYYALYIANGLGITFDPEIIIEDEDSRRGNRNFRIINQRRIQNRCVMIIDDVYTNGHTKGLISSLLVEKGTSCVYLGVIARTIV